jgi:glutathione S-transferase
MALYQKKLKFRTSVVDIRRGRQFSDKFLALNPNGEVPVLVDNEVRIIPGSDKIITYLDDNFSNGKIKIHVFIL